MRARTKDVVVIGGAALAMSLLYRISPQAGRIVSLVIGIIFLAVLFAFFVRRQRSQTRVPLLPDEDK